MCLHERDDRVTYALRRDRYTMNKLIVLEVNEVPLKVWRSYASSAPASAIARLLAESKTYQTMADDVAEEDLYPSQTWASLNTGLPYQQHRIHWYNDPKPSPQHFWWHKAALGGLRTGLVNVLHTSPLTQFATPAANYAFLVPDCFAVDSATLPERYTEFQKINLAMTRKNGRAAHSGKGELGGILLKTLSAPSRFGLNGFSMTRGVKELARAARSRERLRNMQFLPLAAIFLDNLKATDPDVAVLFTNHIAAAQHRYWYALYPEDYAAPAYPPEWVERYRYEILQAMDLLNAFLERLMRFAAQSGRVLAISTSMGQTANPRLSPDTVASGSYYYKLERPASLAHAVLGTAAQFTVEMAMVPQYTFAFAGHADAVEAKKRFEQDLLNTPHIAGSADVEGCKLTLSITLLGTLDHLSIAGRKVSLSEAGFLQFEVDDHHSGCHHPEGAVVVWNDNSDRLFPSARFQQRFSYLDYAPELCRYLGIQ
jgi:hypothetical protein